MILPRDNGYNAPKCLKLEYKDLIDISLKRHDMQQWYLKTYPQFTKDDCFGLPLPYLLAFGKAELFYSGGKKGKGYAIAELEVSQNDPWFYCHFPGDPVMPGSQGQDSIYQLAGLWGSFSGGIHGRPRALNGQFSFSGQIFPYSKKVFYRIDIEKFLARRRLLFFSGSIAVDDPNNIIYEFKDCRLGFFLKEELGIKGNSNEYYRPNWELLSKQMEEQINQSKEYYDSH